MSEQEDSQQSGLVEISVIEQEQGPVYDLSTAASFIGAHPDLLMHYCEIGLVRATRAPDGGELQFDDDSIYWLRQIEALRRNEGIGQAALRLIFDLRREVEELRRELRFRALP